MSRGRALVLTSLLLQGPRPAQPRTVDLRGARVLWVHVGKTGGGSLRGFLRANGAYRGPTIFRCQAHRLESRMQREGPLVAEVHMCPLTPAFLGAAPVEAVAVSVRDPADRLVSAFKWARHRRERRSGYANWRNLRRETRRLFDCFPSVERFARALVNASEASARCAREAARFVDPSTGRRGHHLAMNTQFYLGQVLSLPSFRAVPLVTLDMATLPADAASLLGWLGLPVANGTFPTDHTRYRGAEERVSPETLRELRESQALRAENRAYRAVRSLAINV